MFLMYVDDSGDPGMSPMSPTQYFVLSGLIIHETKWHDCIDELVGFRKFVSKKYGLGFRQEIHATQMINRPGDLGTIPKHTRLLILRQFCDIIAALPCAGMINVVVNKHGKPADYKVFEEAWKVLIQRFENTIIAGNLLTVTTPGEGGYLHPDHTSDRQLTNLLRRMQKYNPIPQRYGGGFVNKPLVRVIEDPSYRISSASLFVQAVDTSAYMLTQYMNPNAYIRKKGARNTFQKFEPILIKKASPGHPLGVVML